MFKRSCGILMPVSALPSKHGIGTMGEAAYRFIDFLHDAGQSWWQILPVGPTSYGDSPYQSFSTFAGNPYFIDLDLLVEDGLLTRQEADSADGEVSDEKVEYGKIYDTRFKILKAAADRGWQRDSEKTLEFMRENSGWLSDYALFMALKRHFGMRAWTQWEDEDIRLRSPEAVEKYTELLSDDIRLFVYIQYLFFKQWGELRKYAASRG
ncbi:MAG: 4-alpha-glucanotransferase, partial [Candidatus Avispirillum sp.]